MADTPFDRTNTGLRERPTSGDLNQMQSQIYRTICELTRMTFSKRASNSSSALLSASGFFHDGFRVVPSSPAAMSVQVSSGFGFRYDPTDLVTNLGATDLEHVDDLAHFKPVTLLSPVTFAVPTAPSAPNSRIDIVEVKTDRRLENAITRRQLDIGTESFMDHVFFKALAYGLDGRSGVVTDPALSTAGLSYKIGVAGNPGVVPVTTTGYTKVAEINVGNATTSISGLNIVDRRRLLGVGGLVNASIRFRMQWNSGLPIVTIHGVVAPPGVDLSVLIGTSPFRGNATIYAFGGEIAQARFHSQGHCLIGSGPATVIVPEVTIGATGNNIVYTFGSLEGPLVAGATSFPPVAIGTGQKCATARIQAYELTATGPDLLSANVEDVEVDATFSLGY